jgi:hypothetical protein
MGKVLYRVPPEFRDQIIAELGTVSDIELARKYTELSGSIIKKHTIFWMRRRRGIPARYAKKYTKPPFTGRLEDAHPEVKYLFGKVPVTVIASYFGVTTSCVRDVARRLGIKNPGRVKYDPAAIIAQHMAASTGGSGRTKREGGAGHRAPKKKAAKRGRS